MKNLLLKIFAILIVSTSVVYSNNKIKFGHINSDLLLSLMPDTKKAEKEMESVSKTYDNEFKAMMQEYQNKAQKYQSEASTKSDAINQSRMKEMQDMELRIQQYQQTVSTEIQKKKIDLMRPIIEKAQKAIDAVAKEKQLTYVFDTSKGSVIYVDETVSTDLIEDVKKKLNIITAK